MQCKCSKHSLSRRSNMSENKSKRRFPDLQDEQIDRIMTEKDSMNTRRSTQVSVKVFRDYLKEKGLNENFEIMEKDEMDKTLSRFYLEMRQANGEMYKKTTMRAIRQGICRHLQECSSINIIHDWAFQASNTSFNAAGKELKRRGRGGIESHPPIESEDLKKLYANYWDNDNPVKLQHKVFLEVMLYFGRRGRENLRTMSVYDVACTTDDTGEIGFYTIIFLINLD